MKNVYLKFIGLGYSDINQADVFIYDINNNLLCSKRTYNNCISICLEENKLYRVYLNFHNESLNKYFYVNKYITNYYFVFNHAYCNQTNKLITFLLTDLNYDNLPIEKGSLILWQKQ